MRGPGDGIRKAAILVASLDTRTADRLLDQMGHEQAARVRHAVMVLGDVDPQEQRRIIDEFFQAGPKASRRPARPSAAAATRGRTAASAIVADAPSAEMASGDASPFGLLREAEAEKLARVLASERPQTVALVLAHLPPEQSAAVLGRFGAGEQTEILRRLIDLEETDAEVLREVEQALTVRLSEQVRMQRRRVAGVAAVTGILEAAPASLGKQILASLGRHDVELAERFALPSINFAELPLLDTRTVRTIFETAGLELTSLALLGAPPGWADRILQTLPEAERNIIRRELDEPGPIRLSDVEEARQRIAEVAQRLDQEGTITLHARGGQAARPRAPAHAA